MHKVKPPPQKKSEQKIINSDSKIYQGSTMFQGADVFILTKYADTYCVVLFESVQDRNNITMPGGRCDSNHSYLADVAKSELNEESRKSIEIDVQIFKDMETQNLQSNLITYVDIDGSRGGLQGKRRVYFFYIDNFEIRYFNSNKALLDEKAERYPKSVNHAYLEMQTLVLIPIENIVRRILEIVRFNEIESILNIPVKMFSQQSIRDIKSSEYNVSRTTMDALYKFLYIHYNFTRLGLSQSGGLSPRLSTVASVRRRSQRERTPRRQTPRTETTRGQTPRTASRRQSSKRRTDVPSLRRAELPKLSYRSRSTRSLKSSLSRASMTQRLKPPNVYVPLAAVSKYVKYDELKESSKTSKSSRSSRSNESSRGSKASETSETSKTPGSSETLVPSETLAPSRPSKTRIDLINIEEYIKRMVVLTKVNNTTINSSDGTTTVTYVKR